MGTGKPVGQTGQGVLRQKPQRLTPVNREVLLVCQLNPLPSGTIGLIESLQETDIECLHWLDLELSLRWL